MAPCGRGAQAKDRWCTVGWQECLVEGITQSMFVRIGWSEVGVGGSLVGRSPDAGVRWSAAIQIVETTAAMAEAAEIVQ